MGGLSLIMVSGGYCLAVVHGLFTAVSALVAERRLQAIGLEASGLLLPFLSSRAQAEWLWPVGLLLCSMWDPPGPGIRPGSPALGGGFSASGRPGKP